MEVKVIYLVLEVIWTTSRYRAALAAKKIYRPKVIV